MALCLAVLIELEDARHLNPALDLARRRTPEIEMGAFHVLLHIANDLRLLAAVFLFSDFSHAIKGHLSCFPSQKKLPYRGVTGMPFAHLRSSLR
mgnify:CR=1 FL=1